ncbi:MAG TPA: hypothetical protein VKH81_07085 [Candidatus Angelobacter sp.]|nr:hypothetical protein [Candidatus Angelobacter sp.]
MKSVLACVAVVLFVVSGYAADERPAPASGKTTTADNREQPPAPLPPAPIVPANAAFAGPAALPAAPSALITVKKNKEAHKFFDVKNSLALSAAAASLTADALSTQKGLAQPGFFEMNPVARPFVQSRPGAAVYTAGSLGLVAAGMYVAHRTNHHKLERIFPFVIAGWEGVVSARNYHVIATRPK